MNAWTVKGALVKGGWLAFDVGPLSAGFAILDDDGHVVGIGEVSSSPEGLAALVDAALPVHVCIEWIAGYAYSPARVPGLLASAAVAGQVLQIAHARGIPCTCITAPEVRRAIVGKSSPKDAEVAAALATFVELPWRSNAHERDAVSLGLAARLAAGLPVPRLVRLLKKEVA